MHNDTSSDHDLTPSSPKQTKLTQNQRRSEGLTSDAHVSTETIQASQFSAQPVNIWYGSIDEPDSATSTVIKKGLPESVIPSGKGTVVAILDSGINAHHTAFRGGEKIVHSKCFIGDSDVVTDTLGHGTQCTGLVCGSPDSIQLDGSNEIVKFKGIAPDAKVMVCKVVGDNTAIASTEAVCDAISYIINFNRHCAEQEKVDVISLSFGMTYFDHTLTRRIQEAIYEDIIVVCAASNGGRTNRKTITYPARLGHVLCIGACTINGKPADFSAVGRELDFLAQGQNIWVPTIGSHNAYAAENGTSFAAPLVAGVVCQIIEDLRRISSQVLDGGTQPLWMQMHNVWCMRELLKEMAVVQGKHCEESGYGALNPKEYFEKGDTEKWRIISNILKNTNEN